MRRDLYTTKELMVDGRAVPKGQLVAAMVDPLGLGAAKLLRALENGHVAEVAIPSPDALTETLTERIAVDVPAVTPVE